MYSREDLDNLKFVRRLAIALDRLVAMQIALPGDWSLTEDERLARRQGAANARINKYWNDYVQSMPLSCVQVEDCDWADVLLRFDPCKPYHEWGILFAPRDLVAPLGSKLVLLGPGPAPRGAYHLRTVPLSHRTVETEPLVYVQDAPY